MSYKEVLGEISRKIHEELPKNSQITRIEFEGPEVAVYSKNPKVLVDDENIVKDLAKKLRKRIVIRSDPSVRLSTDETIYLINELVGKEGEITSIDFDDIVGEVIIESLKPGVIIGKSGEMLRSIISKTFWRPRVMRTPPIESRVIKSIRHILQEQSQKRLEILRNIGKRIHRPLIFRDDTIRVTALGGYAEVGRSSSLVQTGESTILVDCGISVGSTGPNNMFPRFDLPEFDIEQLDAVVVSHAHLDHCLPPDTPVFMADGTWKKVKDVEPGDKVLSFNWETGNYEPGECIGKTVTNGHKSILEIKTESLSIQSSPNHRFFIVEDLAVKEVEAQELEVGCLLPVKRKTEMTNKYSETSGDLKEKEERLVPISYRDVNRVLRKVGINEVEWKDYSPTFSSKNLRCKTRHSYLSQKEATKLIEFLNIKLDELTYLQNEILKDISEIKEHYVLNNLEMVSVGNAVLIEQHNQKIVNQSDKLLFVKEQISVIKELILNYLTKIQYILSLDVDWQQITTISEKPNNLELIDLEVTPNHNFVANYFIVHNSGFVPYLYKYGYDGPVYCTRPTRDLMTLLQIDYLDVASKEGKLLPYGQREIREAVLHTIVLDYGEVTDISPDVRLTFHNAGHIVGSAIPHLHIGDGVYNMAFAHDIKFARSRLLDPAVSRFPRLETLFIESTYGKPQDILPPRSECEKQLKNIISATINRGGIVLIPVLAVGRAQEIIVVIEQLMRNGELPKIPIYTDGMIKEASAITICHPEFLSKSLRDRIFHEGENPFLAEEIKQVSSNEERERIIMGDPAIILATSGMLTGGPSVFYFKELCEDKKNTLIFVSYQGKGTLGSRIQKGIKEIQLVENGKTVLYRIQMDVHSISGFTGHSDRRELENYIAKVSPKPERFVILHGEESKTTKFASYVYKTTRRESIAPQNGTTIRLR